MNCLRSLSKRLQFLLLYLPYLLSGYKQINYLLTYFPEIYQLWPKKSVQHWNSRNYEEGEGLRVCLNIGNINHSNISHEYVHKLWNKFGNIMPIYYPLQVLKLFMGYLVWHPIVVDWQNATKYTDVSDSMDVLRVRHIGSYCKECTYLTQSTAEDHKIAMTMEGYTYGWNMLLNCMFFKSTFNVDAFILILCFVVRTNFVSAIPMIHNAGLSCCLHDSHDPPTLPHTRHYPPITVKAKCIQ